MRSSKGHFVKTSGLRWLSAMLLVRVPWAGRIMALPFLTVLAPSERFNAERPRAPKTLTDWARQAILQICRWLPGRAIVVVADGAFAAVELLAAVRGHVSLVTRLRLDANLCTPPLPKKPGRGRPPIRGKARPKLKSLIDDPATVWQRHTVPPWYSQINRTIEFTSRTALWYRSGTAPGPIRWVLVRDPDGVLEPQAFLCTDTEAEPADILGWFIMRWQVEVTLEETRAHLGVESQRQWSDLAILRTTPALFALFSIVCSGHTTLTQPPRSCRAPPHGIESQSPP
ncbi:MAG: transposase [Aliidongia sp.]